MPLIQEALQYEGQRIAAIGFEPADQPLTKSELESKLPFQTGSIFHERELRQAIQNLYATGRFSDLAVDATEDHGGVALRFLTKRAYFVGRVVIRGVKAPPNGGELASATKLRLGTLFVDADRRQATESLVALLRQNGFYHAAVHTEVEYRPHFEEANLAFDVDTGERARFEEPLVTGNPARPKQSVIRATHWKRLYGLLGWQQVTAGRLRQGLENVRHYYEKRNFLESRVSLTRLAYYDETNTVQPEIDIRPGIRIVLRTTGAKIDAGELKQLVPVFQERSLDAELLLEGERNIQQYLVAEGYFGAQVTYKASSGQSANERIVTYQVTRGSRHKFAHLGISRQQILHLR